jgi:hypothetical protein
VTARQYRWLNWGLALGLLILLTAPRAVTVSADGSGLLLPGGRAVPELCLTKRATGQECSSCHLGRSIVLATKGDMARSIAHHPGGVVLVAWTAVQAIVRIVLALAFAGLARHWWIDMVVTFGTLTTATLGIVTMGR